MDKGYTDITVVVDKSSSMASQIGATIEGFNAFLAEQKKAEGKATISLIQFSDTIQTDYEGMDVQDARELSEETYVPSGMTALNDAVGTAILRAKERHSRMAENERPHKTIIVVITDGEENSSKEFRGVPGLTNLKTMIEERQAKQGWEFIFLGQDLNAQQVAQAYAIPQARAMSYKGSSRGIGHAYVATSNAIADSRGALASAAVAHDGDAVMDFMEQAREISTSFRDEDLVQNEAISKGTDGGTHETSSSSGS